MQVEKTTLNDCYLIRNTVFHDDRGSFFESFNRQRFLQLTGIDADFVQDNQSHSAKGVLRGLHFQTGDAAQAKLVRVLKGKVLDVAVDLRKNSSSFGQHIAVELSDESNTQLYVPRGFAHGFVVLSDSATFFYKCDNYYNKAAESGLLYNDPALGINWQAEEAVLIVNEKDRQNPLFENLTYF